MWHKCSITSREEEEVEVEEKAVMNTVQRGQFSLLVRLLSVKPFNREAFKQAMMSRWRPSQGAQMKDIGDNLFIAIFNDAMDRDLVLMNGPWAFHKNLVLLKLFDGDQKVQGMQLTEASFWIQIHELPFKGMNEETATSVGNALGVLEEIDIPEDGIPWGEFMRVRVRIDVSMPLYGEKE